MTFDSIMAMIASLRLPTAWEGTSFILVVLALKCFIFWMIKPLTSPLRKVQSPEGGRGVLGHFAEILE